MWGPPPRGMFNATEKLKEPKPEKLSQVPGYLWRLVSKFFSRLFYIFRLVWDAKPWILIVMMLNSLLNGIFPVITAIISAQVLNLLAEVIKGTIDSFNRIIFILILQFAFQFIVSLTGTVHTMIMRVANELVTNAIKIKIISKAKDIDLKNFDMPEFYEKMENAHREASMRPVNTLNSLFSIISSIISVASFIVILANVSYFAPLIMVILAIPVAVINYIYRKKNFLYMRWRSRDRREMNYYSDVLVDKDLAKEVKIFSLSDTFVTAFKSTFNRYFGGIKKLAVQEGAWNIGVSVTTSTVNCGIFLFIAKKVYDGSMKLGDYNLYTGALSSMFNDGYSRNTLTTIRRILSGSLNYAVDTVQFIQSNPMRMVKIPSDRAVPDTPTRSSPHVYIPSDKIEMIFKRFPEGSSSFIPMQFGYRCGMRLGEAFGVYWEDIDFDNRTVSINRQVQWHNSEKYWYFSNPKYNSFRTIELDSELLEILKREYDKQQRARIYYDDLYVSLYEDNRRVLNTNGEGSIIHPVAVRENGAFIIPRTMQHTSGIIHHDLEYPDFTFHSFRHTHATMLAESGAPMKYTQERLGHKDITVTMQIYQHASPNIRQEGLGVIEKMFSKEA